MARRFLVPASIIVALTIAVIGCGASATSRRLQTITTVPLPSGSQPPDPCALLTLAQLQQVFGPGIAEPSSSRLATGLTASRTCFWSVGGSALLTMTVTTQAARQEVIMRTLEVGGTPRASVPVSRVDQLADIHGYFDTGRPLDAISVAGLGDAAYSDTKLTTNYYDVAVLRGTTVIDLSLVGIQIPEPVAGLTSLVRDAMATAD